MYRRILMSLAETPPSDRALVALRRIAIDPQVRCRLVHVLQPEAHVTGFERPAVHIRDIAPALARRGQALLAQTQDRLARLGLHAETALIEEGLLTLEQAVLADATAWGADLIVMATHGRCGLQRLALGSHAEALLRTSPLPVLLVREADV
jgi:nucleotide-binding universal stress UspA family protein